MDIFYALQSTEAKIFVILTTSFASALSITVITCVMKVRIKSICRAYSSIINNKNKEIRQLTNEVLLARGNFLALKTEIDDLKSKQVKGVDD